MSKKSPFTRIKLLMDLMEIDAINLRDAEAAKARSANPDAHQPVVNAAWARFTTSLAAMEEEADRLKQELFAYIGGASKLRDKEMAKAARMIVGSRVATLQRFREVFTERGNKRMH